MLENHQCTNTFYIHSTFRKNLKTRWKLCLRNNNGNIKASEQTWLLRGINTDGFILWVRRRNVRKDMTCLRISSKWVHPNIISQLQNVYVIIHSKIIILRRQWRCQELQYQENESFEILVVSRIWCSNTKNWPWNSRAWFILRQLFF